MKNRQTRRLLLGLALLLLTNTTLNAQVTPGRELSVSVDRFANLQEQLTFRLRAFDLERRNYLQLVVNLVRDGSLDIRLVRAVERYAIARNAEFPFPFFERALRFQARRQGVQLPTIRQFASTSESRR